MDKLSAVVTELKQKAPYATTANAERVINQVIKEVSTQFPIFDTVKQIPLQADIGEYLIADEWAHIRSVTFVDSATSFSKLGYRDVSSLDTDDDGWRERDAGDPTEYYISGSEVGPVIGVTPMPDTDYASGYPYLKVLVVIEPPTFTSDMIVPYLGPNGKRYLAFAGAQRFLEEVAMDKAIQLHPLTMDYYKKVSRWFHKRGTEGRPSITIQTSKPRIV